MLWFRSGAVISLGLTMAMALAIGISCFVMCVSPSSDRGMDTDPYYNGTLFIYIFIIIAEMCMIGSTAYGFSFAFKVWKNNHQMDHTLRGMFTFWLALLGFSTMATFVLGILGLVRYREPQEEITSLFEIFARYSQDVKFVGSFERFQRENSCCGVNGPEDWYLAQVKTGGNMGAMGGMGMEMSYMGIGSPSTGKCHLTPPTIPMGCGKKMLETVHLVLTIYCSLLIVETACALTTCALGWYCFFYWIEKEVIIIPEDEVSNLIVIEPESSTTTVNSSSRSTSIPSQWSGSVYSANGSRITNYSGPGSSSRYSSSFRQIPTQSYLDRSRFSGYSGSRSRFSSSYPNSRRRVENSNATQFSNFYGASPPIGGPHVEYLFPNQNDTQQSMNQNYIPPSDHQYRIHYDRDNNPPNYHYQSRDNQSFDDPHYSQYYQPSRLNPRSTMGPQSRSRRNYGVHSGYYGRSVTNEHSHYTDGDFSRYLGSRLSGNISELGLSSSHYHSEHEHKPKKKHSFNHMLHKQEKALGGKILAEMHVDHSRDPDPLNSNMDTAKGGKGHRAHHATIAIVKSKKPPKPKSMMDGPPEHHGQTGHLAEDIIDMSGGAAAVKSMIDDINLPVEHDPSLTHEEGYVNKLHRTHRKKSQLDHPDAGRPGHGPVHQLKNGAISAPSIDGSQAQSLMDNLFHPKPKPPESEHLIKAHDAAKHIRHHHEDKEKKPHLHRHPNDIDEEEIEPNHHHHHHHNDNDGSHHHHHHHTDNDRSQHHNHHNHHEHHHGHSYSNQQDRSKSHHHAGNGHHHNNSYYSGGGSYATEVLFKNPNSIV